MSYSDIKINTNTHFTWPYPYAPNAIVISDINDLTVNNSGLQVYMPYGGDIEVGTSVIFNNLGPNSIKLMDFFGGLTVATLAKGDVIQVYLTASTETSDIWRAVELTGGSIGITELTVAAADSSLNVIGSPITAGQSGNITIGTNPVLKSLGALNTLNAVGLLVSVTSTADNILTRTLVAGNGINILNPDGVSGNIIISLSNTITNLSSFNVGNLIFSNSTITGVNSENIVISSQGPNNYLNLNNVYIDALSNVTGINNLTITGNLTFKGTLISPSVMQAWVLFNNIVTTSTNIISILAQVNVASVTESAGYYTLTFTTPFKDINYGVLISLGTSGTPPNLAIRLGYVISKQTTNVVIAIVDASGQLILDAPDGVTVGITSL